jgi:hypothetical protein
MEALGISAAACHVSVAGSKTSAVATGPVAVNPPATRTRPSASRLAAAKPRGVAIGATTCQAPAAAS